MKKIILLLFFPVVLEAQIGDMIYLKIPWTECGDYYVKENLTWAPVALGDSLYKKVAIYKCGKSSQRVFLRRVDNTWQEIMLDHTQHFPLNAKLSFSYDRWTNKLVVQGGYFVKCLDLSRGSLWCGCPPSPPGGPHDCTTAVENH